MKAKEFENTFDDGETVLDALGFCKSKNEANRVGVTHQSIIKIGWQSALKKLLLVKSHILVEMVKYPK